jgi:hypothetical protein
LVQLPQLVAARAEHKVLLVEMAVLVVEAHITLAPAQALLVKEIMAAQAVELMALAVAAVQGRWVKTYLLPILAVLAALA